jgi:hypothetical protein
MTAIAKLDRQLLFGFPFITIRTSVKTRCRRAGTFVIHWTFEANSFGLGILEDAADASRGVDFGSPHTT